MSRQSWSECVIVATADGTAVANTTTETVIFTGVTIPANMLADGRTYRLTGRGRLSTTATPTMTWAIRLGGIGGTVIWQSGALTMGSGVTNLCWEVAVDIQVRSNGASGTVMAMGVTSFNTSATACTSVVSGSAGGATPATASADFTTDLSLVLTADWSAASASNTLTGHQLLLEALN